MISMISPELAWLYMRHLKMPPAGLEPAPRGLKGRRSNQLSYRGEVPMVEGGWVRRSEVQERSGRPS